MDGIFLLLKSEFSAFEKKIHLYIREKILVAASLLYPYQIVKNIFIKLRLDIGAVLFYNYKSIKYFEVFAHFFIRACGILFCRMLQGRKDKICLG